MKPYQLAQEQKRTLAQLHNSLEKDIEKMLDLRKDEKAAERLDNCQQLTEAIAHAKLSITYLRQYAKCKFGKTLEELDGYK